LAENVVGIVPAHHQCPLYSIVFVVQPLFVAPKRIQNSVADTSVLLLLPLSHLHNFICNTFWAFRHPPSPFPTRDSCFRLAANYYTLLLTKIMLDCWFAASSEWS